MTYTEWQSATLGDAMTFQRGFDLPAGDRLFGPIPVIAATGVVGTHIQAMAKGPGVVIGRSGSIGGGQFIKHDYWPLNTTLWVANFKGNLPRYCYYLARSIDFTSLNVGSGVPTLNRNHIHPLPVKIAPLSEQREIASILGALDDKIDLNRRMNTTLEAMARALFQSWFVDFDPVRAKAEGRQPVGMDAETAALFPDSFEDSALGPIPTGWVAGQLADLASLNPETWSKSNRPETLQYVDLSNTKRGRIETIAPFSTTDAPSRAQRVLRPLDTIVGTVRPGNGSYALVTADGLTGSTGFAVLRPLEIHFAEFVYLAATSTENIDRLAQLADGGTYPAVRPEVVAGIKVAKPSSNVLLAFSERSRELFSLLAKNEHQSTISAEIRNQLLPKLLKGELRVGEVAA